jgi:SNF2 family DNA or RNA helicase
MKPDHATLCTISRKGKIIFDIEKIKHRKLPKRFVGITTYGKVKPFPEISKEDETKMPIFQCVNAEHDEDHIPFSRITWDRIVVDEIHNLRNGVSLRGDASGKLRKKSLRFYRMLRLNKTPNTGMFGLSGTPICNRLGDLASVFYFLVVK